MGWGWLKKSWTPFRKLVNVSVAVIDFIPVPRKMKDIVKRVGAAVAAAAEAVLLKGSNMSEPVWTPSPAVLFTKSDGIWSSGTNKDFNLEIITQSGPDWERGFVQVGPTENGPYEDCGAGVLGGLFAGDVHFPVDPRPGDIPLVLRTTAESGSYWLRVKIPLVGGNQGDDTFSNAVKVKVLKAGGGVVD